MDIRQIQSAYDGYPLTSTVIFLGSLLLATILFKFGHRTVKGLSGFCRRLLPAHLVVMLLLLVNLRLAFNIQETLQGVVSLSPVSSPAGLGELGRDQVAIFTGEVSPDSERTSIGTQDYVAFIGESTWRPISFLVENHGEAVSVSDRGYTPLNWPRYRDSFGDNSVRYLDHGQPVVVVGKTVATTQRPFGSNNADTIAVAI